MKPNNCLLPDCHRKPYARGLCRSHYCSTARYIRLGRVEDWESLERRGKVLSSLYERTALLTYLKT